MFSGVGGFELGLERANDVKETGRCRQEENLSKQGVSNPISESNKRQYTCIGCSEIDKYASELLKQKFPAIKNWGDATKINPSELPDFDMLCGGFPCQAFSIAGKRRGFEDTRGTLFFDVARIIKVKRPKIVFLENVKGLLNHNSGKTFRKIIQTISELGYDVQWMVLNSKFHGVPQNRERVFIIGSLRGTSRPEILPFRGSNGEVKDLVYAQKSDREIARVYDPEGIAPCLHLKTGGWQEPKIKTHSLYPRSSKTNQGGTGHLTKDDGQAYNLDTGNMQAVEVAISNKSTREFKWQTERSPTLQARDYKDPKLVRQDNMKIRRLTPTECERLQGFPEGWTEGFSDTQRYKMMGNAVTVNVIRAIARRLTSFNTKGKEEKE